MSRLDDRFIDELKQRVRLSDLVGKTVKLKRQGREYAGLSPFTKEKTPSFFVNDDKGFYHCLAGDTEVMTPLGLERIDELARWGGGVVLTRGGIWVSADFRSYGRQPVYDIVIGRAGIRKTIRATSAHRWFYLRGEGRRQRGETTTEGLRPGMRLEGVKAKRDSRTVPSPFGIAHGFTFGDGTAMRRGARAQFCGPKDEQMKRFFLGGREYASEGRTVIDGLPSSFKRLPSLSESPSYLLGFVAGYIAADGCVSKAGTVSISSANLEHLTELRLICDMLGIVTYAPRTQRRTGYGGVPRDLHQMVFDPSSMTSEMFVLDHHRARFEAAKHKSDRSGWRVISVTFPSEEVEVFCAEVADTHCFALADNLMTGNCFSSGKHGDVIEWLMETERLTFREAVERLAADAGMTMPADDPQQAEQEQRRGGLRQVLEDATKWMEQQLRREVGLAARGHLSGRGFPEGEWGRFRVGYAPDGRTAMKDALIQRGHKVDDMVEAGLLIRLESGETYDRFRNRVMFPIMDHRGRVVSFSGRALDAEARAKYLNGPETPLFSKGAMLYGLHEAKRLMGAGGQRAPLVAAEGCMDAIAFQRAGIGAVAPLGTALTEDQLEILWKAHPEPILCFDGDAAGERAAGAAIDRALPMLRSGRSLWFAMVRDAKDPDELLKKNGPGALRAVIEKPYSLVSVLFHMERRRDALDTPERREAFRDRLRAACRQITDRALADAYQKDLMERWVQLTRPARRDEAAGRRPALSTAGRNAAQRLESSYDPVVASVVAAMIDRPSWVEDVLESLSVDGLGHEDLNGLARDVVAFSMAGLQTPLRRWLEDRGWSDMMAAVERSGRRAATRFLHPDVPVDEARGAWRAMLEAIVRLAALDAALDDVRDRMGEDPSAMTQMMTLKAERDTLRRKLRAGC